DPPLAGCEIARHVAVVLFVVRRRHQNIDLLADDLAGGIPEQLLRGRIERLDSSVAVDDHDAVHGRLDDRSPALLARTKPIFKSDSFAQVVKDSRELPLTVDVRLADREMQRKDGPVPAHTAYFATNPDDLSLTGRQIARDISVVLVAV